MSWGETIVGAHPNQYKRDAEGNLTPARPSQSPGFFGLWDQLAKQMNPEVKLIADLFPATGIPLSALEAASHAESGDYAAATSSAVGAFARKPAQIYDAINDIGGYLGLQAEAETEDQEAPSWYELFGHNQPGGPR